MNKLMISMAVLIAPMAAWADSPDSSFIKSACVIRTMPDTDFGMMADSILV